MLNAFTRTLTFRSNNLGKDSTLVLTFDDMAIPRIYEDVFPTAFKVTAFGEEGFYEITVTYVAEFGFTRAQMTGGVVVPASTNIHIDVGQQTTLTKRGSPEVYSFSKPQSIVPPTDQMVAINGTDMRENIGVGFYDRPDRAPITVLVFERVGSGSKVQTEFIPILGGYITSDYQGNVILKAPISTHPLFKENLVELDRDTYWRITYNKGSGAYKITPELARRSGVDD